jgi:hypothetical protein
LPRFFNASGQGSYDTKSGDNDTPHEVPLT